MNNKWKPEEIEFLVKNYPIYGGKFCAHKLSVPIKRVQKKVDRMGLRIEVKHGYKVCRKCYEILPLDAFTKDAHKTTGLSSRCKCCNNKMTAKYRAENPEKYHAIAKVSWRKHHEKNKNKLSYRITKRLRSRLYNALRGATKWQPTFDLLGCNYLELLSYLKSKMSPDMTWDDVLSGKIHIDHIRPCSSFDMTNEEEQKKCFHYSNLQPLWAKDNLSKGCSVNSV